MNAVGAGLERPMTEAVRDQNQRDNLPEIGPGLRVHFVGVGGIGMSGLARLCLGHGAAVTGADHRANDQTRTLSDLGATVRIGEHPDLIDGSDLVVYSTAIQVEHPERVRAAQMDLPTVRRGTLMAHLLKGERLLAVAGTHGKTTSSSMLALAVRACGLDPSFLVGGEIPSLGTNALIGSDDYFVAETDESDGSFLELEAELALVTNVDDDHVEHYGNLSSLHLAFEEFIGGVSEPLQRILCSDCPCLYSIARRRFGHEYTTYGFTEVADIQGTEIRLEPVSSECTVIHEGQPIGQIRIGLPGLHMLSNALGVLAAGLSLDLPVEKLCSGLSEYRGTRRRFEHLGRWKGASLIDDYAHHPTEIEATLQALRQSTLGRCIVVFQPHRHSRTEQFFDRFGTLFGGIDVLLLTDIYSAGEQPRPGTSSKRLLQTLQGVGEVVYAPLLDDVSATLREAVQEGDTILFLGAGDISGVPHRLLAEGEGRDRDGS